MNAAGWREVYAGEAIQAELGKLGQTIKDNAEAAASSRYPGAYYITRVDISKKGKRRAYTRVSTNSARAAAIEAHTHNLEIATNKGFGG